MATMRKLTYYVAPKYNDSHVYSMRAATRKALVSALKARGYVRLKYEGEWVWGRPTLQYPDGDRNWELGRPEPEYYDIRKVEVKYTNAFDLWCQGITGAVDELL